MRSGNRDDPLRSLRRRRSSALNTDLDVAAFEFELGDVFLDEELDEFFNFFLVHALVVPTLAKTGKGKIDPFSRFGAQKMRGSPSAHSRKRIQSVSKSLGQEVKISQPVSVTTTVSSMRIPHLPGR